MNMRDSNPSQGFGGNVGNLPDWNSEDNHWRASWSSRPYAASDRTYEHYQPAYRYGYESGTRHRGRQWEEVEPELRAGWDRYEGRGNSTWEHMKDAVRDAWHRVAHR